MSREILEQAHIKLQNKQYHEARYLLLKIPSDPTAAKWLTKIDAMKARQCQDVEEPRITLSKPLPEVGVRATTPARQGRRWPSLQALLSLVAVLIGAFFILSRQMNAALGGILNPPETYQSNRLMVTHGWGWQARDVNTHGWCTGVSAECLYYVKSLPNIGVLFTYMPLTERYSAAEFADSRWYGGMAGTMFVVGRRHVQETTIAGIPAAAQMYGLTEHDEDGGEYYMIDVYMVDGEDGYVINIYGESACELSDRIGEINSILSSMRVANPNSTDGYAPANPVALTIPACQG